MEQTLESAMTTKPYGKDSNTYDKSKDSSSVTIKKIKCNNININLNGFSGNEIGTAPTSDFGAVATQAQAEDEGANGANFGNDGRGNDGRTSAHDSNSRFVCINNNDNSGRGETPVTPVPPVPPVDPCEECFRQNLNSAQFEDLEEKLAAGLELPIAPRQEIVVNSLADLCNALEGVDGRFLGTSLFSALVETEIIDFEDRDTLDSILECIAQALGIEVPSPPTPEIIERVPLLPTPGLIS